MSIYFLYFEALTFWDLADPGEMPLPALTPGGSKRLACKHASQVQTSQSRLHIPKHLLYWAPILWATLYLSTCFIHPGVTYQTTRDSPYTQSPLKSFKLALLKSVYSASPDPSHGNHSSRPYVPLSLCPPGDPSASSCGSVVCCASSF